MNINLNNLMQSGMALLLALGLKLLEAIAIWIVGRWLIKDALKKIPNVVDAPAPDVEILTFTLAGPVLAVRPYCNNKDYWQVYFDANRVIKDTVTAAGFSVPETHYAVRGAAVGLAVAQNA